MGSVASELNLWHGLFSIVGEDFASKIVGCGGGEEGENLLAAEVMREMCVHILHCLMIKGCVPANVHVVPDTTFPETVAVAWHMGVTPEWFPVDEVYVPERIPSLSNLS